MAFDPFGDFETAGYLRNHAAQKDMAKVKDLEHDSFRAHVGEALEALGDVEHLGFDNVKSVHETLFQDVYPWAGEDRSQNANELAVLKGPVEFMHPLEVERGVEYALNQGAEPAFMRERPGEVLGNLAYAHPFLDGNGRTIMTVHSELCRRAEMHIDWSQTDKQDYLSALTEEIDEPGKGHLDAYLKPYVREGALDLTEMQSGLQALEGLGPTRAEPPPSQNELDYTEGREAVESAETPEQAEAAILKQAEAALASGVISEGEFQAILGELEQALPANSKDSGIDDDYDPF